MTKYTPPQSCPVRFLDQEFNKVYELCSKQSHCAVLGNGPLGSLNYHPTGTLNPVLMEPSYH
jgi:hypothetical protein